MFKSIRWRIGLSYVVLIVVCMSFLAAYILHLVREYYLVTVAPQLLMAVLLAVLVAAVLAIVLAFVIAGATVWPVRELTHMARRLAAGDLDQKIRVVSEDEIGELARAFNQMSGVLKGTIETMSNEHSRMAAILANMADGIIITDGDANVTLVNKAAEKMLHLPKQDYLGRSIVGVVRDHQLAQLVGDCLAGTGKQEDSARLIELGTPKRFLRAVVTTVREGGTLQVLLVLQDLTEVRRAEAVRREFIANVSHELRTPLASVKALVETLRDGALHDPAVAEDFLTRMDVEVDGLTQLVRELLELSRIESGQVALKLEPAEVNWLIETSVERLRAQAERSGVSLEAEIAPGLAKVMADGERVQQVLINLIHNAIKFTPAGGNVTVRAAGRNAGVCVSVADTGIGIPAENLSRVFERFYKADKSRSSGGTGLGLAVAKHIVQAHGGEIWVESVEGQGATFSFTLPLA
ncbi:MAG: ATP-binding protein [Dehalococcoidales bacterium]|nr:ATP-binding protein [Dehalococcoidales bacterium]